MVPLGADKAVESVGFGGPVEHMVAGMVRGSRMLSADAGPGLVRFAGTERMGRGGSSWRSGRRVVGIDLGAVGGASSSTLWTVHEKLGLEGT